MTEFHGLCDQAREDYEAIEDVGCCSHCMKGMCKCEFNVRTGWYHVCCAMAEALRNETFKEDRVFTPAPKLPKDRDGGC